MKEVVIKNKIYKLYDCIDELPIINFQKYNKFLLLDSGLGSDIDSVDSHLLNLARLIKTDKNKAAQELQNLRQNMYMIVSEISPKYYAFAALIHSIDGEKVEDLSDDNLKKIIKNINTVKHSKIVNILMSIKKKLDLELETYFPSEFGDSPKEKENYDKFKNITILKLEQIIYDVDNSQRIESIYESLFSSYKPKSFIGSTSAEVKHDKNFESSCMIISQETSMDAKRMTVLEFYNTLAELRKQADAKKKALKK